MAMTRRLSPAPRWNTKPGKAFNPIVPAAVVKELDDMAAQFKTGALKIAPTEQDARSGG